MTSVELPLGEVLYRPGATSRHVYFPGTSMVSLVAVADRSSALEVGLVGSEGMVGIPLALGIPTSPVQALVQGAGSAMRMTAARFGKELKRNRPLQRALHRCAYIAMATAMQSAVCNKAHLLEARLARWLLMTQDRVASDRFQCTQEAIALMLGVRRTGVTDAASGLQRRKLIRYSRGAMEILHRPGLLAVSQLLRSHPQPGAHRWHGPCSVKGMGTASNTPKRNRLLAALPEEDYRALLPFLEPVVLPLGMALYESGGVQGYVYFPTSSIVSLLYVLEDGSSAEIAVTGSEGLVGIALFMGGETTPSRAVVQSAGRGYRIKAAELKQKFEAGGALQYLLLRFTQALITQMTQTAVCNRHHAMDQQLCRWLLLSLDRLPANDLVMTQQLIANMLGVRREGVTEAAGKLQAAGLIEYSRGRITVLDRPQLEARVCECYAVVKQEYDRLLSSSAHS